MGLLNRQKKNKRMEKELNQTKKMPELFVDPHDIEEAQFSSEEQPPILSVSP